MTGLLGLAVLAQQAAAAPAALAEGVYTNEEQVSFAAEAGRPAPPWTGLHVARLPGGGWRLQPVDAHGRPAGEGRVAADEAAARAAVFSPGLDMRLARPFRCWAAVPRAGTSPVTWWGRRDILLHDQGGRAELVTDEPEPQRFTLKLRNVVWPSGPNQPSLVLYVLTPAGGERAVAYSWADPEARRVGLNIRTIQASCTRDQKDATMAGAT